MIAIVGGGISGLSAAWYLAKAGRSCTLIERNSRLGGVIETAHWENCVLEGGPDSFLSVKPEAAQLVREAGLGEELISSNDHQRVTYIWKRNRLVEMPDGLMMMIPTKVAPMITTPLFSWPTKIRMGLEVLRGPSLAVPEERTVGEFVSEHYGRETVDYLADPLLSGVYGGSADALSIDAVMPRFVEMERKYGSLTRGALAARKRVTAAEPLFRTLKRGLTSLVETMTAQMSSTLQVVRGEAEQLEREPSGGGGWRLRVGGSWLEARQLILATPAYAAAALLRPHDAEAARLLETVPYASSMTVALGYRPGRIAKALKGFGFLVPKVEGRRLRALTVVQNKFPNRAPEGYTLLRCFLGGIGREAVLGESDATILAEVRADIREMLGVEAEPDYARVIRWHRSMAQYLLGHTYRMRTAQERVRELGGVYLAGNAYSGIGIPDCVRTGKLAAEAIVASST